MGEPQVFALPPGVDFAPALLAGLRARLDPGDPLALARCRIIVNTERAARRLREVIDAAPVSLPPQITVLSALAAEAPDLPPLRSALGRRLRLARLVRGLLTADATAGARTAAYPLADTLAALLGEMHIEAVPFAALRALETEDAAGHWERSLTFLGVIETVLAEADQGADAEARLALGLERMAARWQAVPPEGPVVVAGSTGSRGATARFMAAVAALPQGYVVLPGMDRDLPGDVWKVLQGEDAPTDHPQSALARFCARVDLAPEDVPLWQAVTPVAPARNRLASLALRPAPVTDQWLRDGPALVPDLAAALGQVTWLEAEDAAEEARAIALVLRRALAEGKRAALITPDRTLARRVTAALDRWQIRADDSAGRPLAQTPPGVLLRLSAGVLLAPPDPVALVALLKHPLVGGQGAARGRHLGHVARLEAWLRRHGGPQVTAATLSRFAAEAAPEETGGRWCDWLAGVLQPPLAGEAPLPDLITRHVCVAEALVSGAEATGAAPLWEAAAGEAALALWQDLTTAAGEGGPVPVEEYPVLLRAILGRVEVPDDAYVPHPGLAIWGTLEARVQSADLVILGGLGEGRWPGTPKPDPWLSRDMRRALGLPLPEAQIGLSAHDFQQAFAAREVVLSCPRREGEAPAVPSRWVLRLDNLLGGLGDAGEAAQKAMRARGAEILALTRALAAPEGPLPRAPRPAPIPPPGSFPPVLPVTRIERLAKDPYEVYARDILRLRPLDPLRPLPDFREMGTQIHAVLHRFVADHMQRWPEDAEALFRAHCARQLAAEVPWPSTRRFWQARLEAFAGWFAETEPERRAFAPPALLEDSGRIAVEDLPQPFSLTAKADRIDAGAAGPVAIYDYKNSAPGKTEMARFYPQLRLEAVILERGGFADLGPRDVGRLAVIQTKPPATMMEIPDEAEALAAHWAQFRGLIAAFQTGAPFAAGPPVTGFMDPGAYEHLARVGEWDAADPPEPERLT